MKEIWLPVLGYERLYEISNTGRVKSLKRKWVPEDKILKPGLNRNGYPIVALCKSGKMLTHRVHRLVAEAFIPNPANLGTINHKNCSKTDNRLINLEWSSHADNIKHAVNHGKFVGRRVAVGEAAPGAILNDDQVMDIFNRRGIAKSSELARLYRVAPRTVRDIWNGITWQHLIRRSL